MKLENDISESNLQAMNKEYTEAIRKIKQAILKSQYQAAKGVNAVQLSLYYGIGRYVSFNTGAKVWGTGALDLISNGLQKELPGLRGFSSANMKKMRIFYEQWHGFIESSPVANHLEADGKQDIEYNLLLPQKSSPVANFFPVEDFMGISFSHHMEILHKTDTYEERIFYIHQTKIHQWNKYDLRDMLKTDIFHRQGTLPNNFLKTMTNKTSALKAVSMFRDEYFLDYMNIDDIDADDENDVDERVVEKTIVRNIKKFIVSLGSSFCFIGNQYRVEIGGDEFFIDLLFYNRELKSLVAIELKRGAFKPSYLGQLNFYLDALDKKERREGENPSIGLLLCQNMNKSVVELAVRSYSNPMGVATYRLPSDVPEEYKAMRPIMEHAQLLLASDKKEEEE